MDFKLYKVEKVYDTTYLISNEFIDKLVGNLKILLTKTTSKSIKVFHISNYKKLDLNIFNEYLKLDNIHDIEIINTHNKTRIKRTKIRKIIEKKIEHFRKKHKSIGININNDKYISNVKTVSKDLDDDISNIVISSIYDTLYDRYQYIYDRVCDKLDENFVVNNFCNFENDVCIANRDSDNIERTNGCCHSFLRNFYVEPAHSTEELTQCKYLQNKRCQIKNISCKFFVCGYLKKRGIYFDILDNFLLRATMTRKQLEVVHINFFKPEEEILNKLVRTKYSILPYWLFTFFKLQLIDSYWKKPENLKEVKQQHRFEKEK